MKRNRFLAVIIMAVILFVIGFSLSYIAQNEVHKCSGKACPVCMELEECEAVITNLGGAVFGTTVLMVLVKLTQVYKKILYIGIEKFNTLISLKVKLSD